MVVFLFDFDQTLVFSKNAFIEAERNAMMKFFDRFSHKFPDWTLDYLLEEILSTRIEFYKEYNYSRKDWWSSLLKKFGIEITEEILDLILAQEIEHWDFLTNNSEIFPDTIDTLHKIKDYWPESSLGVISDTDGLLGIKNKRIDYYKELKRFFDLIVVSGEGKYKAKPYSDSYDYAKSKLSKVNDEKVFFIGDNIHRDIIGAIKSNCIPIWLTHVWVYEQKPILPPKLHSIAFNEEIDLSHVIQIKALSEIIPIVQNLQKESKIA